MSGRKKGEVTGPYPKYQQCGMPADMRKRAESTNPGGPKICEDCEKVKHKLKKCLSCDMPFTPGCRVSFVCNPCFYQNKSQREDFGAVIV